MAAIDRDVLCKFFELYQKAYPGSSPTYRDVADLFGVSTSQVSYALDKLILQRKLVVQDDRSAARSVGVEGVFLTKSDLSALGVDWNDAARVRYEAERELRELYGRVGGRPQKAGRKEVYLRGQAA